VSIYKRRIGVFVIILLVLVPLFIFLNKAVEEDRTNGKPTSQAAEAKAAKPTKKREVVSEKTSSEDASQLAESEEVTVNKETSQESGDIEATETEAADEPRDVGLKDFLVVIDPGHQLRANLEKEPVGPNATETKIKVSGGTTGVATGKPEYVLTLEASLLLGQMLEKNGVQVIYTRTTHNVSISNRERAEIANQNKADLFVRIHADGAEDPNVTGLSVLTPAQNNPYTVGIYQDSLQASQMIIEAAEKNPAIKVNGVKSRSDLSGFNWSQVPSTLIEMGYMTNPTEDKNLSDEEYLTKLLTDIADGILQYARYKGE
jgi:N-acetylmuramoyl-L-alanine amidase